MNVLRLRDVLAMAAGFMLAATLALTVGAPVVRARAMQAGIQQERDRNAAATLAEILRQRESVRAAEAAHEARMSDLQSRVDAARPGREQEILRHERVRIDAGRGCALDASDVDWLLSR